jgi:hypothetical protein
MDTLTQTQRVNARVLQLLSTLYYETQPENSFVSSREIASLLELAQDIVDASIEFSLTQGFISALTEYPLTVRLDPAEWSTNITRTSGFYAYFVFNAPAQFRNQYSLFPLPVPVRAVPVDTAPAIDTCRGRQPCQSAQYTYYNGVIFDAKYNEFCCTKEKPPPYEIALPLSNPTTTCQNYGIILNLFWLNIYRQQSITLFNQGSLGLGFVGTLVELIQNRISTQAPFYTNLVVLLLPDSAWPPLSAPDSLILQSPRAWAQITDATLTGAYSTMLVDIHKETETLLNVTTGIGSPFTFLGLINSGAALLQLANAI